MMCGTLPPSEAAGPGVFVDSNPLWLDARTPERVRPLLCSEDYFRK